MVIIQVYLHIFKVFVRTALLMEFAVMEVVVIVIAARMLVRMVVQIVTARSLYAYSTLVDHILVVYLFVLVMLLTIVEVILVVFQIVQDPMQNAAIITVVVILQIPLLALIRVVKWLWEVGINAVCKDIFK